MTTEHIVTKEKLDSLAESIGAKAERRLPLTIDEMKDAVDSIDTEPELQTKTVRPSTSQKVVTADKGYDGLSSVTVEKAALQKIFDTRNASGTITYYPEPPNIGLSSCSVNVPGMTLPSSTVASSSGNFKASIGRSTSIRYLVIPAGYNNTKQYYSISDTPNMTLPTSTSTSSSGTSKLTITPGTADKYINIPTGYNSSAAYYTISAMPTMTLPTSTSTSSSGTLKLTIMPGPVDRYLTIPTGYNSSAAYYTISGDADLVPSSIVSGKTIFGVEGSATASTISQDENTKVLSIS